MSSSAKSDKPKPKVERILFLCLRNSSRSKIAQAYLQRFAPERFVCESAGLTTGKLTYVEKQVMLEDQLPIDEPSNTVFTFFNSGKTYDHVISVCDQMAEFKCATYPGSTPVTMWVFEDPAKFRGTKPQRIAKTREVRDRIKSAVKAFILGHTFAENLH